MSKVSKVTFAAFMQHCTEYVFNVAHVKGVESVLSAYRLLAPPGGKAHWFIVTFCPVGLVVCQS